MAREEDFTFEQKEEIIIRNFHKYDLLCPTYGIIKCPSCYCKMALGFDAKKDGTIYYGNQNYQKIHIKLGYRLVPNFYTDISRIHIDHLHPIYQGGIASFENGIMICENCNLVFSKNLSVDDKLHLLNNDLGLMECDNMEYDAVNSKFIIRQNGKIVKNTRDIIMSILCRREQNKCLLEILPMYD